MKKPSITKVRKIPDVIRRTEQAAISGANRFALVFFFAVSTVLPTGRESEIEK
jgi:hypothetical protein